MFLRWPPLRCLLFLVLAAHLSVVTDTRAADAEQVTIVTANGSRFPFHVEIADSPREWSRGLMHREEMAEDAGMLFLFKRPDVVSFWMKNTPLSLDLLFIAADGRVASMHQNAVPYSTQPMSSDVPVTAVLEVLAGTAKRLGIREGDRVEHKAFTGGG